MQSGRVLVIGCSGRSANTGLEADEKAILANDAPVVTVSTGSVANAGQDDEKLVDAEPSLLRAQINDAAQADGKLVVKIGALFSEDVIKTVSEMLQQRQLPSVVDVEPFFNTGTERTKEDITAFRKYLLPQATVLSGTVREIKSLLDDAGIPTGYPRGIPDIKLMGEALGKFLGPKYVIVKREILDAEEHATTLHCVLSGPTTSSLESYRCHNPTALFGVSYSIPAAIAANLARGCSEPDAVAAGYKFVEEMLKGGEYFV